jgi:hypothetical protein
MEFVVEAKSHMRKKFITALLPSMLKQLKIDSSKKALVIIVDPEIDQMGLTLDMPGLDSYLIAIKPQSLKDIGITLGHELTHCADMIKGKLKSAKNGGKTWCGKLYPADYPYLDTPFERRAFAMQEILFRRALES